jgi:glycosyltransferase involved in cell wall biosynthesis
MALGKTIRKLKPNIVFSTMLKSNILIFFTIKLFHIKSKLVLRESTNRSVYHYKLIEKKIFKLVYNKADKIIALSQGVSTDLIEKFKIKSNNISVIYNPVDIDAVNIKKKKIGIKLDDSLPTIISVGRLIEAKDYHTLLMAYSELKKNMDFHAYILGKGELYDSIKDEIETLGLEKMVTLLGFNENPYAIMGQANLFVLSSKWEGFGNVIIEAMALGLPIITTDCNYGPREIITNNTNGVLVEVGNYQELSKQIFNILNSSDFSKKFSRNATIRAKDFSSEKIIGQYEKMLLSL